MRIDVVYDKSGQLMTTYLLVGCPLTSITAWQWLVLLLTSDWQRYNFRGKHLLMNNGDWTSLKYHKETVHNLCMPQFDLFQSQTTAYSPLSKDKAKGWRKNNSKFSIILVFRRLFFLENYDFFAITKETLITIIKESNYFFCVSTPTKFHRNLCQ